MATYRTRKQKKSSASLEGTDYTVYGNSVSHLSVGQVQKEHSDYLTRLVEWERSRDCLMGEAKIKSAAEKYLPRPAGMSGEFASAYLAYIERAHFPLISGYALQGALGVITSKLPEFNVPENLSYIVSNATRDGRSLQQLFVDIVIDVFVTGRVPLVIDILEDKNQFRFIQYTAEDLINWDDKTFDDVTKSASIAVLRERDVQGITDIFNDEEYVRYKVLHLEPTDGGDTKYIYKVSSFNANQSGLFDGETTPLFMGVPLDEIPLIIAGSINNSFDIQPIPLISVANCSIQIYRKEADLANSEFLSCNPTLVACGVSTQQSMPNVVGSSVMMCFQNDSARVFYTKTDTAALQHVSEHISNLQSEAIRHGVAILDDRKGVEAAEALRIRQATQSASLYSIYLSVLNSISSGLRLMCKWAGYDMEEVKVDASSTLSYGIPDASVMRELIDGFYTTGVIPLEVVHKYITSTNLLEQTVNYDEYVQMLENTKLIKQKLLEESPEEDKGGNGDAPEINKEDVAVKDVSNKKIDESLDITDDAVSEDE